MSIFSVFSMEKTTLWLQRSLPNATPCTTCYWILNLHVQCHGIRILWKEVYVETNKNFRKQLASAKTFVCQSKPLKIVWQDMMSPEYQWALAETCIPDVCLLTKLLSIAHHIKIYLFTIKSSKIHNLVTPCKW